MGGRDARHPPLRASRAGFWLPVLAVAVTLGVAAASLQQGWRLAELPAEPDAPAAVAPPAGLTLPVLSEPEAVAAPAEGDALPMRVRRALGALLGDGDLGRHVVAAVAGLDGEVLFERGSGSAIPASTLKLLTAAAALERLGPEATFATTVVREDSAGGPPRVVLVGGGDPLLERADLARLARATARGLDPDGTTRVRVGYDTSLFDGPEVNPRWPESYIPENVVSPISPLWIDQGRDESGFGRVADPAAAAADAFAEELRDAGLRVRGTPLATDAAADAVELARVESDRLDQLVEHVVGVSDNEGTEVLARHTAIAAGEPASFAGGARAVLDTVAELGVPTAGAKVFDGSGLSRDNRLRATTLTTLLSVVADDEHPHLRPVLTGLPVAAFTGSLATRYDTDPDGRGWVRAKTGTLTGVTGLAGIVTDRTGTPMVFALLADRVAVDDTLDARARLDEATGALAACRCGVAGTVAP